MRRWISDEASLGAGKPGARAMACRPCWPRSHADAEPRLSHSQPADQLPSFKALRLNLGTAPTAQNPVIDAETWTAAEIEAPARAGRCVLGLDLGDGAAMSAAVAYWPRTGGLEALAAFPSKPDLAERGTSDGVGRLYEDLAERGELIQTAGRAVDVGLLLAKALHTWGRPVAIVADRYRERDLRQALDAIRFPQAALILRGQGFKDGAEDVRGFRRAVLTGAVHPVRSLLLRAAFAEAVTVADPAGNEKLAKNTEGGRRKRARDDAAAAAILAVAEGSRRGDARPRRAWRPGGIIGEAA